MSSEIPTVDSDTLRETWALRGHPVLLRRRWQRHGLDVDSDESLRVFCASAPDGLLVTLLVDLASMSDEPELHERGRFPAGRLAAIDARS